MEYRIESDSLGEVQIPAKSYYGNQTYRAFQNFKITGHKVDPSFIRGFGQVKKASAIANNKAKLLSDEVAKAIIQACDEVIAGKLDKEFIVDPIQGGAGTSLNMNANEVIANRANEILGGELGVYDLCHPNDHVNFGQSTNDAYPTAGKIGIIAVLDRSIKRLERLELVLRDKAEEFKHVIKMGRTQMQDAVPITLGQEFHAYASVIARDRKRFIMAREVLTDINLGATAIGTGLNCSEQYIEDIIPILSELLGYEVRHSGDLIDGTQNVDGLAFVSSTIKTCAISLSKIANDLRLMSSGPRTGLGEINLPSKQNGSSIMPGKINPVIPEVVSQVCFNVIGNDMTITMCAEAGQLELNAFEPMIFYNLYESFHTLNHAIDTFIDNCIVGITANEKRCAELVHNSVGMVTALCAEIGYKKATDIAKEALNTDRTVKEVVMEKGVLTEEEYDRVINPLAMTLPGIRQK